MSGANVGPIDIVREPDAGLPTLSASAQKILRFAAQHSFMRIDGESIARYNPLWFASVRAVSIVYWVEFYSAGSLTRVG